MKTILAGVVCLAIATPALAHSWYSKKRDPIYSATTCCGGTDCAPLPSSAITYTPDGELRVVLTLEQAKMINPLRSEPFDAVIPFDRIQTSEDGRPHICLMARNSGYEGDRRQGFFCIFMPPNG